MVAGVEALHARFAAVPEKIKAEVTKAIETTANDMVRQMRAIAPLPEIAAAINWTWGDAPAGSLKIAEFRGKEYGAIGATIYVAKDPAWFAHFFEFGTGERAQKTTGRKTGRIVAQPFFWPIVRANQKVFRSRVSAALRKALKAA